MKSESTRAAAAAMVKITNICVYAVLVGSWARAPMFSGVFETCPGALMCSTSGWAATTEAMMDVAKAAPPRPPCSQISALVADNYAVEGLVPDHNRDRHTLLPIHHLCLFTLGVPLGELWYLHDLAAWLREHHRSRFLLTAPPLRLRGVQGSPLTPVATV